MKKILNSLACALLLCLLKTSESKSSPRSLGVKGSTTRGNLGRRNNYGRVKQSKQQQDRQQVQAISKEEALPEHSYDESNQSIGGASKGGGAVKSSAQVASKYRNARKGASDSMDEYKVTETTPSAKEGNSQKAEMSSKDTKLAVEMEVGGKNKPRNKQATLDEEQLVDQIIPGAIRLSPFAIIFDAPGLPLTSDYSEAARVTTDYLEPFMFYIYDDALEFFTMTSTRALYTQEGPQLIFAAAIKFIDGTIDPSDEKILGQIEKVFAEPALAASYLELLQRSLDPGNPLQQSTRVTFYSQYNSESGDHLRVHVSARGTSDFSVAGAFAGAALVLAMSGYLSHGNHSNGDRMARLYKNYRILQCPGTCEKYPDEATVGIDSPALETRGDKLFRNSLYIS